MRRFLVWLFALLGVVGCSPLERRESARSGITFCLSARGEGAEAFISVILSCWILSVGQNPTNSPRDRNTIICGRHKHMNEML